MQQGAYDLTGYPARAKGGRVSSLWKSVWQCIIVANRTLALWHVRAESRRELAKLDEQLLKDLRLDAIELNKEASKPFWRA